LGKFPIYISKMGIIASIVEATGDPNGAVMAFVVDFARRPDPNRRPPPSPPGPSPQSIKFEATYVQSENVDRLRFFQNVDRPNATRPSVVRNGADFGRMVGPLQVESNPGA
jgi:hypothetical protein